MYRIGRFLLPLIVLATALSFSGDTTSHGVTIRVSKINYFDLKPADYTSAHPMKPGSRDFKLLILCRTSSAYKRVTAWCSHSEGRVFHHEEVVLRTLKPGRNISTVNDHKTEMMSVPIELMLRGAGQTPYKDLRVVMTVTDIM